MIATTSRSQPDILEVIADLSNEEVRTPPRVANAVLDLLPDEVWTNRDLRWLDPACKTGIFLREITRRLLAGLEGEIPDEDERLQHILRNMVFGISTTELSSMMSRRTTYCSKDATSGHSVVPLDTASGNVWFKRGEHAYKDGRCAECSASEENTGSANKENYAYSFIHTSGRSEIAKEMDMHFDIIVGNPPYQMKGGGGGTNDTPLYHEFFNQAKALNPSHLLMIMPARWMAGGRGLDDFRADMLSDRSIRDLVDFPDAEDVFPGVPVKGGVCYVHRDAAHDGDCTVTRSAGGKYGQPILRDLRENDVFVRDHAALQILRKVTGVGEKSAMELVSGDTPFGLATNFDGLHKSDGGDDLKVYAINRVRTVGWIQKGLVTKNADLIAKWKVLVPEAYGAGESTPHQILGVPIISEPDSCCTQSYLAVGPFSSQVAAESFESYFKTRFFRFLVSLRKISQHGFRSTYKWVPQQLWDRTWTDTDLYEKYGINEEEQSYIASMVKEMPRS